MRERVLDLVFLVGVLFKGLDGLVELVGGVLLLFATPATLLSAANRVTAEELSAGKDFGRYMDVDGDGIPYRTYPGTHPTRGAFFTRGTSKDTRARYSEEGHDYQENMLRLLKKFDTAP